MRWRRDRQPEHPAVLRHADGRPWLADGEAARIAEDAKAALVRINDQPFPVAQFNDEYDWRARRHLEVQEEAKARHLPAVATAATGASASAGWVAELVAGPVAHLAVTGGSAVLSAAALAVIRVAYREQLAGWGRQYTAAAAGAVGWTTVAAALGPGAWALSMAALVGGGAAVATPWRRAHPLLEHEPTEPEVLLAPEPRPELPPAGRVEEFTARWAREVSGEVSRT